MASLVTDTLRENINCCTVTSAALVAHKSQQGSLTKECVFSGLITSYQNDILQKYVENGTVLVEGFISSATLDLSAFAAFGTLTGNILVDGNSIGFLPEATYADIDELLDGLVQAIADGGTGYTAVNNGDGTITVVSPGPGAAANGFIVSIVINPVFVLGATVSTVPANVLIQMIQVNNPASAWYGYTIVANNGRFVYFILNGIVQQVRQFWPNPANPGDPQPGSGAYAIALREFSDTLFTAGNVNRPAWETNAAYSRVAVYPGVRNAVWAVYNPFNNATYFQDGILNQIHKIDALGAVTSLSLASRSVLPRNIIDVDRSSTATYGNVWSLGAANTSIINPTTLTVTTTVNNGGIAPGSITFYPGDGTASSERMFISYPAAIIEYGLDGTEINPTFYTGLGGTKAIFYSSLFNVIFVSDANDTHIVRMDGTLKQVLTGYIIGQFLDDVPNKAVVAKTYSDLIHYFVIGDDGLAVFDGALEDGTDDVLMTEADQCVAEELMNTMASELSTECGCSDCGNSSTGGGLVIPGATYTIYYGNSSDAALTFTGIAALTALSASGYAGTYTFPAGGVSDYSYFAIPTNLGTPSRLYDPASGFDIAFETVYQVVINSVVYDVRRTYYPLGGNFDLTVTP